MAKQDGRARLAGRGRRRKEERKKERKKTRREGPQQVVREKWREAGDAAVEAVVDAAISSAEFRCVCVCVWLKKCKGVTPSVLKSQDGGEREYEVRIFLSLCSNMSE